MSILGGGIPRRGAGGEGGGPKGSADVVLITEREFEAEVIRSELPVLIEFWSDRSQASKQGAAEVDAFARDMRDKLKVVRVDVDKSPLLVRELRVQAVPTFMLFVDQRIADAQAGPMTKKRL